MIHSETGIAERDCVFKTSFRHRGRETWSCYLYEPERKIGYLRMGGGRVTRLEIELGERDGTTEVRWTTVITGLNWWGNRYIKRMDRAAYENEVGMVAKLMEHYLQAGTSLTSDAGKKLLHGGPSEA